MKLINKLNKTQAETKPAVSPSRVSETSYQARLNTEKSYIKDDSGNKDKNSTHKPPYTISTRCNGGHCTPESKLEFSIEHQTNGRIIMSVEVNGALEVIVKQAGIIKG
jgi:hypothetical protein